jgi:hypothetical protein
MVVLLREQGPRGTSWVPMNKRCLSSCALLSINVFLSSCGGGGPGEIEATFAPASAPAVVLPTLAAAGTFVPQGSSSWPRFVYPQPGDPQVDTTQQIQWTAANNTAGYELQIGTTVGGSDVFDSGVVTATSIPMPVLPSGVVLYARVRAVLNGWSDALAPGHWPLGSYTVFRTDGQTPASTITNVAAGAELAAGTPLEWSANPLAVGYQLKSGANSSPVIHSTHAFITAPAAVQVTVTLDTIYLTGTVSSQLILSIASGAPSFSDAYKFGQQLAGEVRNMADRDNQPYGLSALSTVVGNLGLSSSNCGNFETALLQLIDETNVPLTVRPLDIEMESFDTHTLVEAYDEATNSWLTLDPTFGLTTLGADGAPATSAQISAAARAQDFSSLSFEFLTNAGAQYAQDYYIDYPLLFIDVETPDESGLVQAPPSTLAPYFDALPLPVAGNQMAYSLQCAPGFTSATAELNTGTQTMVCSGPDQLTGVFWAETIQAVSGNTSASAAWQLRRFVF